MCRNVGMISIVLVLSFMAGCSLTRTQPVASPPTEGALLAQTTDHPAVYLNYVRLTLDSETFAAISKSKFVRDEFCLIGQSAPSSTGGENSFATYLLGQISCLELLAPASPEAGSEGNSGICFSTTRPGDIETIYDNLRAELGYMVRKGSRSFDTGSGKVPWFRYVTFDSEKQTPPLVTWVTEHDPMFHKVMGPNTTCRLAALPGTSSPVGPQEPQAERLFRNITGVTLSLTQAEFDKLGAELSAYGYVRKKRRGVTVFSGPGVEVRATVSEDPKYRIRGLRCSLTAEVVRPTQVTFGDKATLTLTEDATAIWTFGAQPQRFARK